MNCGKAASSDSAVSVADNKITGVVQDQAANVELAGEEIIFVCQLTQEP